MAKIAVAGAGIYGSLCAIKLAELGHTVDLFDPLGVMRAASGINQFRLHAGYHYPRSPETITEVQETRAEFMALLSSAIVWNSHHHYAIPHEGSRVSISEYESVLEARRLPYTVVYPSWIDFGFIRRCYKVVEHLYDISAATKQLVDNIRKSGVDFHNKTLFTEECSSYDFVVWATYGAAANSPVGRAVQVVEKVLIQVPKPLRHISLVVIDGPFTGFDPYGNSEYSLFGSALHTVHRGIVPLLPQRYTFNGSFFSDLDVTKFYDMRADAALAVPGIERATYVGSKLTLRVVENSPEDRRTLYVSEAPENHFHIFSGKVTGAVKAARLICKMVEQRK